MRLPSFKRLVTQDYDKDDQKLVDTLSSSLNGGIESLYETLNNNVSLSDNIKCTVKQVTLQVDSQGKPKVSTSFLLDIKGKIWGCSVVQAVNVTNPTTYPLGAPFISYTQNDTIVTITNVTGLQQNNTYVLTLIAWNQ